MEKGLKDVTCAKIIQTNQLYNILNC